MKKVSVLRYLSLAYKYRSNPLLHAYLSGRHVLDIGCGEGAFLEKDPRNFVGIDVSPEMVATCRNKGMNASVMSALELKFENDEFDAVVARELIEHFSPDDAVKILSEAARIIKLGGIIYLTTPGVKIVWDTFSHIRPYPPAAFEKLLNRRTEDYIGGTRLALKLEAVYGFRRYSQNKFLQLLWNVLDFILPPSDPLGWVIILTRIER